MQVLDIRPTWTKRTICVPAPLITIRPRSDSNQNQIPNQKFKSKIKQYSNFTIQTPNPNSNLNSNSTTRNLNITQNPQISNPNSLIKSTIPSIKIQNSNYKFNSSSNQTTINPHNLKSNIQMSNPTFKIPIRHIQNSKFYYPLFKFQISNIQLHN